MVPPWIILFVNPKSGLNPHHDQPSLFVNPEKCVTKSMTAVFIENYRCGAAVWFWCGSRLGYHFPTQLIGFGDAFDSDEDLNDSLGGRIFCKGSLD